MNLSKFGDLMAGMYTDRLSIRRHTTVTNADGTKSIKTPKESLYSDVACRISFDKIDSPNSEQEDRNPIHQQVKVFCTPTTDIKKGDILVAERIGEEGQVLASYKGIANLPLMFVTHQEVSFVKQGDA